MRSADRRSGPYCSQITVKSASIAKPNGSATALVALFSLQPVPMCPSRQTRQPPRLFFIALALAERA